MNKGFFIVLVDDRYSPTVAPTAVGFAENVSDKGTLFTCRFSGDRVLNLREGQFRQATATEVAANNADPDDEDFDNADEDSLTLIRPILADLNSPLNLREYVSAAKMRAHGSLSTDRNDIAGMLTRIEMDQRDMKRNERDHFAKIAEQEEKGDKMEGERFDGLS